MITFLKPNRYKIILFLLSILAVMAGLHFLAIRGDLSNSELPGAATVLLALVLAYLLSCAFDRFLTSRPARIVAALIMGILSTAGLIILASEGNHLDSLFGTISDPPHLHDGLPDRLPD